MSISLITFICLYVGGILLVMFADLAWGVALYILLYFIFPGDRWWYTLPPFRFTYFLSILIIFLFILRKNRLAPPQFPIFPQAKWLILMIVLMALISFWAVWPEQHNHFLRLQMQQMIFMYIAYRVIDREEKFDLMIWAFLAGCFYFGYLAHGIPRDLFGRLEAIRLPDSLANGVAAVLVTSIPLIVHYLITGNSARRILALLCFPFIFNAIILLNSRGATLGLTLGMAYFVFNLFRQKTLSGKIRNATVAFILISAGIFLYLADETFLSRMSTIREVEVGEGGAARTNFWRIALDMVPGQPFGFGVQGFEFLSPRILPEEWLNRETGTITVHSTYIQALVEFGYLGGIILAGFILSTFRLTRKIRMAAKMKADGANYSRVLALESSYIAFLTAAIFIDRLYAEVFYWMMLFIAIFANIYLVREHPATDHPLSEGWQPT